MWDKKRAEQALLEAGVAFCKGEPLNKHTSFQVGGPAAFFCMPKNIEELKKVLQYARVQKIAHCMLGRGSNVLFKDEGYDGFVISLCEGMFANLERDGTQIYAGAAVTLSKLCTLALQNDLSGLEFAYGIPGAVAGAIYMNAGAYGGEMCDVLSLVHILDEDYNERSLPVSALKMGYRHTLFQQKNWVILGAEFNLKEGSAQDISAKMQSCMQKRKDKQPLDLPSAGSAFKRPPGAFAAALIDECGLKGKQVGGAAVSEKHSGFLVNVGGATCQDIVTLADEVADIVYSKTGIQLEREFQLIES